MARANLLKCAAPGGGANLLKFRAALMSTSNPGCGDSPGKLAEPADEQRRPGHGRLGVLKSKPTKVVYRTPLSAIYTHSYRITHATEESCMCSGQDMSKLGRLSHRSVAVRPLRLGTCAFPGCMPVAVRGSSDPNSNLYSVHRSYRTEYCRCSRSTVNGV